MKNNNGQSNEKWDEYIKGGMGEEERDERDDGEDGQDDPIVDGAVEDDERFIPQEVEEEPGGHHDDKDDQGDGVPEKAEEDDQEDDDGVIHAKVAQVGSDSDVGFAEAVGDADRV